jgi:hypothetical protein
MYATPAQNEWSVEEGRDRYLAENGFTLAGYSHPYVVVKVLGRAVRIKNRASRQRVVPLHDLHHVATGYGTDLVGEAEIGAWELRAGCNSFILYYLNGMAAMFGLLIAPRRVVGAWRRAAGQRSLYVEGVSAAEALQLSVGELRARLGVPPDGAADRPARLHPDAPAQPAHRPA